MSFRVYEMLQVVNFLVKHHVCITKYHSYSSYRNQRKKTTIIAQKPWSCVGCPVHGLGFLCSTGEMIWVCCFSVVDAHSTSPSPHSTRLPPTPNFLKIFSRARGVAFITSVSFYCTYKGVKKVVHKEGYGLGVPPFVLSQSRKPNKPSI